MSATGIGASVLRKEDPRFLAGRGNYVADIAAANEVALAFVRSPVAHGRIRSIVEAGGGGAPRVHRRRPRRGRADARAVETARIQAGRLSGARHRQGALRGRDGGGLRRRDPGRGGGPRADGRGRVRGASTRGRHAGGARAGRPAGPRVLGRQHRAGDPQRRRHGRDQGARRAFGEARDPHEPPGHGADGGARGAGGVEFADGPAHRPYRDPGAASDPRRARAVPRAGAAPGARHRAGRGRRVRTQDLCPAGGAGRLLVRHEIRPPGALDLGPARAPNRGRQLPRAPLHRHRAYRRRRQAARPGRRGHGRCRGLFDLPLHQLPGSGDGGRQPAGALCDRGLWRADLDGGHQQAAAGPLSRRGEAGRRLRDGDAGRCGGAGGRARTA